MIRNKKQITKKLISVMGVFLIFSVICNMTVVFASEKSDSEYVVVARIVEPLDNDIVLIKELSILDNESNTYSFVGSKTGRVEHKYVRNGTTISSVSAYAVFQSSSNDVSIYDCNYSSDSGTSGMQGITNESASEDYGSGYAKYSVSYDYTGFPARTRTMWIKCTSAGSLSTSGNQTYGLLPANQVTLGDSLVSFG